MASIPLIGPTYELRNVNQDAQRTMNWYPQIDETRQGAAPTSFVPTPGMKAWASTPGQIIRPGGLWSQAGRFMAVAGAFLFDIPSTGGAGLFRASLSSVDGQSPVWMTTNGEAGHQLYIAQPSSGAILDLATYVANSIGGGYPAKVLGNTFMDGYFIAFTSGGFQISKLEDGLTWSAADKASRSEGSDPVVGGIQNHREIWLFGELTTEVWYNNGAASFPFAPVPGVFLEMGCAAASTICRFDNGVIWLGNNRDGSRIAVAAVQYAPQRISTHAIEQAWATYPRVDDAYAFVYQQDGHTFYQITFPSAGPVGGPYGTGIGATWVYDVSTRMWHERGFWNTTLARWEAHRAVAQAYAFGKQVVGDRLTSNLCDWTMNESTDLTAPIRRMRRTAHLTQEHRRTFFSHAEIALATGLGLSVGQGVNPQVMLRWSDDGAHTWSPEWWVSAGRQGQYEWRALFDRLGSSRDRVFEVTVSDPIPWRMIAAFVNVSGGTH
jgi:hypothetical protein